MDIQSELKKILPYYDYVVTKWSYPNAQNHVKVFRWEQFSCSFYMSETDDIVKELFRTLIQSVQEEKRQRQFVQKLKDERQETTDKILDVLGIELPPND